MNHQKYALITGTSSGLGFALANQLATNGYIVFAGVRNQNAANKFSHFNILPVILDITHRDDIDEVYNHIKNATGKNGLAVLINNAGINYLSAFEHADEETERLLMEVNLLGPMQLTRKMLPLLHQYVETTTKKAILINVSSIGGIFGLPWETAYHASKFAMLGFSQSLRLELEALNINVCCFMPGGMKTEIFRKATEQLNEKEHKYSAYYNANLKNITHVMEGFEKGATPAAKAAHKIVSALKKQKLPLKLFFGVDAVFIRIITTLGLTGLVKNRFVVKPPKG